MKCPVCPDTTLLMSERQGVEIDYCPNCRGIWLDRGELDKLIQLSGREDISRPEPPRAAAPSAPRRDDDESDNYRKPHRKKSWLGDILDFD